MNNDSRCINIKHITLLCLRHAECVWKKLHTTTGMPETQNHSQK